MAISVLLFFWLFQGQVGSTSNPCGNLQLPIVVVPDWSVQSDRLPVTISAGSAALNDIFITGTFVEDKSRRALPGQVLVLCLEAKGPDCTRNISIPAQNTKTVYLKYEGPIRPGVYGGKVTAYANGCASSTSAPLKLYVSSDTHLVLGILVVLGGGFLAWWVKVYASNRVTRDQALLPIALLTERIASLDSTLKSANVQLGSKTPNLSVAFADWIKRFDVVSLEVRYGLPRKTPSPFIPTPTISSDYTTFISQADSAINLLGIFVREGVEQILELTAAGQIPSPLASQAIVSIDGLFIPSVAPELARKSIQDVISKAQTPGPSAAPQPFTSGAPPISQRQLLTEIRRLNIAAWCVLLATAALGTIITLVLRPGFGTVSDYLFCFATSFGIPMVGSLVMPTQTTAAMVTNTSQGFSGSKIVGI